MEENSNQDKKKMIMALVVGIVTLLVLVIGATYAYFQVNTSNNNTNSNVTVKTGKPGTATLKPGVGDLHIILNNVDMSETNKGIEYYADDTKNYVDNEPEGKHTISTVEITDGDSDVAYKCTVSVEVNLTTDAGSMGEALQTGDVLLNIEGQEIDLYNVKETNPTTVNLSFSMYGNGTKEIKAYAKLINKNESQNYLSGRQLKVNIASKNLDCDVYEPDPKIVLLRSKDTNGTLSKDIVGGMYRYQGVGNEAGVDATHKLVDNNYICFGTSDKNACLADEEKYMYRIIGITEEGQLKLIKMQPIEENDNKIFQWWTNSTENIEWPDSLLFKRLNDISNGDETGDVGNTNIFINSTRYEYMNSNNKWYNLIVSRDWMYGDIGVYNNGSNRVLDGVYVYGTRNNGLIIYDIETGVKPTQTYDKSKKTYILHQWSKNKSINAKIGLMYLHDYYLAYDNERDWDSTYDTNNWIYKDNNNFSDMRGEWGLTRRGVSGPNDDNHGVLDFLNGGIHHSCYLKTGLAIATRPVFYLTTDVTIKDGGEGTKTNPFILDVE